MSPLQNDAVTIDSGIHGHGEYKLVCDLARVDELLELLMLGSF